MGKLSLAATSLVAALPGAVMTYLGVMAFLGYAEKMPGMLKVVAGATVGVSALVALSPLAILIFGPKSDAAPKKKKNEATQDEGDSAVAVDDVADDGLVAEESVAEVDEFDASDDFSSSTDMEIFDEDAEFDTLAESSDDLDFEGDDDFMFDDDEKKA